MTTLFTAIFYLWLVLTFLLAVMWFLREQDRRRKDRQDNELEEELLSASGTGGTAANRDVAQSDQPAEEPVANSPVSADESDESDDPEAEDIKTPDEADRDADAVVEPLPWSKTGKNKQKSKSSQRKRSKGRAKSKVSAETADEPGEDLPSVVQPVEKTLVEETPTGEEPDVQPVEETLAEEEPFEDGPTEEAASVEPEVAKLPGIVDLLDGVTLPFDLTPLTTRIEDPNHHAIFVSPHPDAAEVGTAFADELVQQGFEIEAAGFDQALATRGTDKLSMRISPDAGTVADGSDLRYPSANENDVAIEVWIGNGSPPPLSN